MSKHRNGDGENAVHDASERSGMAVASVTKPVVVFFEVGVAQNGSACPMMESIIEGQRASSPHEDCWSQLTALAAFFCDRCDAAESPEGVEITEPNGVVGIAEHGGEHVSPDAGQRGKNGRVGAMLVGQCLHALEPLLEMLVGGTTMLSNEE